MEKKEKKAKKAKGGSKNVPIDIEDDNWQVSMLDIQREEVTDNKWQRTLEIELQQEKWDAQEKKDNLDYHYALMVKYKDLQTIGFNNHQILKMIPQVRPIIDSANMPVHAQLSPEEEDKDEA